MSDLSRSERSERTRERLLSAGLEILREEPAELVFDRLDARSVASRSGVTTGAFYHHFDGADGFVEALLQYSLEAEENPPFAAATPVFEQLIGEGSDFAPAMSAAAAQMMRFQDRNHTFTLQMAVWAKRARSVDISKRLRQMYRKVEDETADYYSGLLAILGREMRPPYEMRDLAGTFIALFEGLSLRRGVDPEATPDHRLGELLPPLILLMTREVGDARTAPEWLTEEGPSFVGQ